MENNYFRDEKDIQKETLETSLPSHLTEPYYNSIKERLKELFAEPQQELEQFNAKYGHLIDGREQDSVENFSYRILEGKKLYKIQI